MEIVKETIRKYYKYQYSSWTRPNISSNGTLGGDSFAVAVVGSSYNGDAYQSFDGSTSTSFRPYAGNGLIFYNPIPLNITNLACNVAYSNEGISVGTLYASNNGTSWTTISTSIGGGQTWSNNITMTGYYKYFKLMSDTVLGGRGSVAELLITATQRTITTGTSSDYDYYEDVGVYKIVNEIIRKYYKYQYSSWTQPVLSANGTIGGNSFAVDSYNSYGNNYAYYAFDGVTSGTNNVWSPSSLPAYITIYNPSPLNITSITVTDWSQHFARTGTIEASNDNITYTTLTSWTSTNSTSFGQWTIDLSSNTGYYKYYRYKVETSTSSSYANTVEITLTATQRTATTGTSSDYDYYEDINTYYTPKF